MPTSPTPPPGSTHATTLRSEGRWQIAVPERRLTTSQLVILDNDPGADLDRGSAGTLITSYRRARAALGMVDGCRGFMISFAVGWTPGHDAVGEPEPIGGQPGVLHVFGRGGRDDSSPARAMAIRRTDRHHLIDDPGRNDQLAAALDTPAELPVPARRTGTATAVGPRC